MPDDTDLLIRTAADKDAPALAAIYNHYIAHSVSTFDESPLPALEFVARLASAGERGLPWLVAVRNEHMLGFACANPWKQKSAYRFVAETSIYMAPDQLGRGLGGRLYAALINTLRAGECHQAVACISLPNPASVRLHEALGFRPVGRFRRVGCKFERWIDVGYWQLELRTEA